MAYKSHQKGFTIIELMISLSVFAVAVTLITMGVLVISRQYQQGVTRTKLESANREVHQTITQAVQFSGGDTKQGVDSPSSGWTAFCVGTQRFVYGTPPTGPTFDRGKYDSIKAGLYEDTVTTGTCPGPSTAGTVSTTIIEDRDNLLPKNAKVVKFSYNPTTNLFSTRFVSSDGDLLDFGSGVADDITCKSGIAGKEFCAVVSLNSSAIKRINN